MCDQADGVGPARVPVIIKAVADLGQDLPGRHNIEIAEIQLGIKVKILIGDIATADNGHLAIGDQQLVVHAMVGAFKIIQVAEIAQ